MKCAWADAFSVVVTSRQRAANSAGVSVGAAVTVSGSPPARSL